MHGPGGSHCLLERGGVRVVVPLHREVKRGTLKKGILSVLEEKLGIPQREWRGFLADRRYRKRFKERYELVCSN